MSELQVVTSKDIFKSYPLWFAFAVSLVLYLAGVLFPGLRIWGVGQWAHFPWHIYLLAVILAVLSVSVATRRVTASSDSIQKQSSGNGFLYFGLAVFLLSMTAFYLFRVRLHFLGDGYTLLANIALENPIMKSRNLGEMLVHEWVYSVLSGENSQRALLTYQLISYAGGAAFVLTVLLGARSLFEKLRARALFSLGMLSGGYMLLFFGYAEHYSLFVPSVALFGVIGLLIFRGKLNRWYILPPLLTSIFFHVFGVALVPAALYVLLTDSRAGQWWIGLGKGTRILIAGTIVAGCALAFAYFYSTNYFFRFAFVPVFADRFTIMGYTLFSLKHVADIINLSLLLLPGFVMVVVLLFLAPTREIFKESDLRFLLIFLLSSLLIVSILDPKMGMARDWDLFAFYGIPLSLASYYYLSRNATSVKRAAMVTVMAITLGFFALIPRVAGQNVDKIGMAQIYDYARLDTKKSLFLFQQMHNYYWERGQYERSPLLNFDFNGTFPEYNLTMAAANLREQKHFAQAVELLRDAIKHNPTFAPAYGNLGSSYFELGQYDSAVSYLTIALGLSPHRVEVLCDLGRAYQRLGRTDMAEKYLLRALSIDPDYIPAGLALLNLYDDGGKKEKHDRLLVKLAASPGAPARVHRLLGEYYQVQGALIEAKKQFQLADQKSAGSVSDTSGTAMPVQGD